MNFSLDWGAINQVSDFRVFLSGVLGLVFVEDVEDSLGFLVLLVLL